MKNKNVLAYECSKGRSKKLYGLQGLSRVIREKGSTGLLWMLSMVHRIGGAPTTCYEQVEDGDKISIQWEDQGLNLCCCDCALVHYITFEVIDKIVVMTIFRNEEETEKARGAKGVTVEFTYE